MIPVSEGRRNIRRILGLLDRACVSSPVTWELQGTVFENKDTWDNTPPTGKGFNWVRRFWICSLLGLWGATNLAVGHPALHGRLLVLLLLVAVAFLISEVTAFAKRVSARRKNNPD